MPKVLDDPALWHVEQKLNLLGLAVGDAIEKMTDALRTDANRFGFALFVIDSKSKTILHTSDIRKADLYAALAEFLSKQSH